MIPSAGHLTVLKQYSDRSRNGVSCHDWPAFAGGPTAIAIFLRLAARKASTYFSKERRNFRNAFP